MTVMDTNIEITVSELQIVAELDSRQFGFLKLNDEENVHKKNAANKSIQYLERVLVQANLQVFVSCLLHYAVGSIN